MEQIFYGNYVFFITYENNHLILKIYNKISFQYYENNLLNYQIYNDLKQNIINENIYIYNSNKQIQFNINNDTIILNKKTILSNNIYDNLSNNTYNLLDEMIVNYINNIKMIKLSIHHDERYFINMNNYYIFNDCYDENSYSVIKNNIYNVHKNKYTEKYIYKINYFFNKSYKIISNIINCHKICNEVNNNLIVNEINEMKNKLFNYNITNGEIFIDEYQQIINDLINNINKIN
jgi:hypothetical protein